MSAQPAAQPVPTLSTRVDVVAFRKAVTAVSKLIAARVTLPALKSVALTADRGGLTMEATDLETSVTMRIPGWSGTGGRVIVPMQDLKRLLRAVPAGSATLEVGETVTLTVGDAVATCRAGAADDFPTLPTVKVKSHTLDPDEFDLLDRVAVAASSDDARPVITAVQFDGTVAVATDSYRLHRATVSRRRLGDGALVPARTIRQVATAARGREVTVGCDDHHARFSWTRDDIETEVTVRLVDGTYPNYRVLVDGARDGASTMEVPRRRLLDAVRRHAAISHGFSQAPVVFEPKGETTTMRTKTADAELVEVLDIAWPGEVALNVGFLSELLRSFDSDDVTVHYRDHLKPILADDGDLIALLMPMRVY